MTKAQVRPKGRIEVSPRAIASLVHEAVISSYGIVGTVPKDLPTEIVDALAGGSRRGIVVQVRDGKIIIDLYVVVEYGTRIAAVARSAMNVVKYTVEKALGIPVAEVNVHVAGIRVSDTD
ncbi:MAG: Asp23/Gls24 family envelope stress response protein [Anaerolineae bacterium]|nr:Asp23/Gls24 family envelope stress response protein [Anaerolineae bacterium]MCX8066652.1 Asp23/Gls24 family envelope stress response protein [Anaerolineae bacterium]MDW7991054.1 Asp23/Gls24 family envelope stress response protein [Anaerolineae bacterium]